MGYTLVGVSLTLRRCRMLVACLQHAWRSIHQASYKPSEAFLIRRNPGATIAIPLKMCLFRFSTQHFIPFQLFDFPTVSTFSYLCSVANRSKRIPAQQTYFNLKRLALSLSGKRPNFSIVRISSTNARVCRIYTSIYPAKRG